MSVWVLCPTILLGLKPALGQVPEGQAEKAGSQGLHSGLNQSGCPYFRGESFEHGKSSDMLLLALSDPRVLPGLHTEKGVLEESLTKRKCYWRNKSSPVLRLVEQRPRGQTNRDRPAQGSIKSLPKHFGIYSPQSPPASQTECTQSQPQPVLYSWFYLHVLICSQ